MRVEGLGIAVKLEQRIYHERHQPVTPDPGVYDLGGILVAYTIVNHLQETMHYKPDHFSFLYFDKNKKRKKWSGS